MRTLLVFAALLALAASRKTRDAVKGDFKPYPTTSVGLDLEVKQLKDRVTYLERTKRAGGNVDGRELKSIYMRLNNIEQYLKTEKKEKEKHERDEKKIVAYVTKHEKELREGGERLAKLENTVDEKGGELMEGVKYIKEQLESLTGRVTVIEGELKKKEAANAVTNQTAAAVPNQTVGDIKKSWFEKKKGEKTQGYKKPYNPYAKKPYNPYAKKPYNPYAKKPYNPYAKKPYNPYNPYKGARPQNQVLTAAANQTASAQNATVATTVVSGFPILNAFWKNQQAWRQRALEKQQQRIKEQKEKAEQAAKAKAEEEKENNKWLEWAVKKGKQAKKFIKKNPQDVTNFMNSVANLAGDAMANVAEDVVTEGAEGEPEMEMVTDTVPDNTTEEEDTDEGEEEEDGEDKENEEDEDGEDKENEEDDGFMSGFFKNLDLFRK